MLLTTGLPWLSRSGPSAASHSHPPQAAENTPDTPTPRPIRVSEKTLLPATARVDSEEIWGIDFAGLGAPLGVFPVAYLNGQEQSAATRRLVTPDLRVRLDSATAE